jgi:hypothetical protein
MNIKKYVFVAIGAFFLIVLLTVGVSARFSLSNIVANPYQFIEDFFEQWSPALSAAGTIIVAALALLSLHESRRSQERERERAIHALHDEIHSNLTDIITLRYQISDRITKVEKLPLESFPSDLDYHMPFHPIDTAVFDSMRNAGQLHWLGHIRMDIVTCYKAIQTYNRDAGFKPHHLDLLATLYEVLRKALSDIETNFKFLPRYLNRMT